MKLKMRLRRACLVLVALRVSRIGASPLFDEGGSSSGEKNHNGPRLVPRSHVRHEWHDEYLVDGWTRKERANASASLPMRIGLMQSAKTIQKGHDTLMDMSVPLGTV